MRTNRGPKIAVALACLALLSACDARQAAAPDTAVAQTGATSGAGAGAPASGSTSASAGAQPQPPALDPAGGSEIGFVYEAFLSPQQEPGEEKDTPGLTPQQFRSTAPSLLRSERTSRGHGVLRFAKDLSKAYVDVKVENVKVDDVVMFHIHCGRPDQLGPIIVDFALSGNIQQNLADGTFSVTVTNEDIEKEAASGEGLVGAFTAGCPIVPGLPDKVKTVAGMQHIAERGELYFNLHTKGQTFYGDMRGQIQRMGAAP
jgi:hypothetical protein